MRHIVKLKGEILEFVYPLCPDRITTRALLRYFTGFMEYYDTEIALICLVKTCPRCTLQKNLVNCVEKCHHFF